MKFEFTIFLGIGIKFNYKEQVVDHELRTTF